MAHGFIYILKNPHMPSLVKIGYTERSPNARALELSRHTGVPGSFSVVKSWRIPDAGMYEAKLFRELARHRASGEHFKLSPQSAVEHVNVLLRAWGVIDHEGLTLEEKAKAADMQQSFQLAEEARKKQEIAKSVIREIEQSRLSSNNEAYEVCRPYSKKKRNRSIIIWSVICFAFDLYLEEVVHPVREGGGFFLWVFGLPFVWILGEPTTTPAYEKLKASLFQTAREGILQKYGLPLDWEPPASG